MRIHPLHAVTSIILGMLVALLAIALQGCAGGGAAASGAELEDGGRRSGDPLEGRDGTVRREAGGGPDSDGGAPLEGGSAPEDDGGALEGGPDPDGATWSDGDGPLVCAVELEDGCDEATADDPPALIDDGGAWTFAVDVPRSSCQEQCTYQCAYLVIPDSAEWDFYGWGLARAECSHAAQRLTPGRVGFALQPQYHGASVGSDRYTWTVEARPRACSPEPIAPPRLELAGPYAGPPGPNPCP